MVKHTFSIGNLFASTIPLSVFKNVFGDHNKIGLAFSVKSTAVPFPSSSKLYHQLLGKYLNFEKSFFPYKWWPWCSEGIPLPQTIYLQTSRSILAWRGPDRWLRRALVIAQANCWDACWSLSLVTGGWSKFLEIKVLISQKFLFYFWVGDKKLVNTFFNTFWFSLFIREIYGLKAAFFVKISRIKKSLGRAWCDVA